jgi:putrescine transport system substrate-binding protein
MCVFQQPVSDGAAIRDPEGRRAALDRRCRDTKRAKNAANAHRFLQYLMQPKTIADITNTAAYANANTASLPFVENWIVSDPGIFPSEEVRARLRTSKQPSSDDAEHRQKTWGR